MPNIYIFVYYIPSYNQKQFCIITETGAPVGRNGEQIKLALVGRKLSAEQVSERAGMSIRTLFSIEKGKSPVGISIYIKCL